ncbi:hypothetical protein [Priestia flexa]|nr:hypothetical protein [Priestia flexa]HDM0227024.1 hypothetical protein [Staphylococcus aureus]
MVDIRNGRFFRKSRLVVGGGQASLDVEPECDPKLLPDVVRTLQSVC